MKRGQSFIEVVLALAVFAGMIATVTSMITGGFSLLQQSDEHIQADALARTGIEAARAQHQDAWNAISYTASSTELIGNFMRTSEYRAVCRDASGVLVTCPGLYTDVQSKELVVTVSWEIRPGVQNTVVRRSYLTNWNSRDWEQTDWSGGAGQTLWSDASRYDTGDSINAASAVGSVRLSDAPDGQWSLSGGGIFIDTSDTDFNQGSYASTTVQGSGEGAHIDLDRHIQWAIHQDSASSTTRDVNAVSALAPNNVWAAADNGEILYYNGSKWVLFTDVGSSHLRGIHMRTSSDGWAVGQSGAIFRYNGSSWALAADTGVDLWFDVYAFSNMNVWVVGSSDEDGEDGGRIAHYDGTSWSEITPPSDDVIYALSAISANDIWAAGKSGRIWRYNGTSWTLAVDTGGQVWRDIVMLSSTNGWAVGDNGALAQWNGTEWSLSAIPSSEHIRVVYALSTSDIWAGGNSGHIWHYNGVLWSLHTDLGDQNWRSMVMTSSSGGWVGGNAGKIGVYGLLHDSGGTFTSRVFDSMNTASVWSIASWIESLSSGSDITIATRTGNVATPDGSWSGWSSELTNPLGSAISSPSPRRYIQYRLTLSRGTVPANTPSVNSVSIIYNLATTQNLRAVASAGAADVWAVGSSGKIIHYNGSAWNEYFDTGGETWNDIAFTSSSNGWATGDGGALAQWNGSVWSESSIPSSADIHGIYALSSSDIWAAGKNGRIWHFDGSSWTLHTDTGDEAWNDIVFTSASNGWAAGDGGKLAQWNGTMWAESTIPSSANIFSLSAISSSDLWAVGANGRIWRYNGSTWSLHTDTGDQEWHGLAFANADDGWAVGSGGALQRWLNGTWSGFISPTGQALETAIVDNPRHGWAVGANGTVLEFYRETAFVMLGTLQSSAFSFIDNSPAQSIEWTNLASDCAAPCQMKFQVRTAPDSSGAPGSWTSWYGAQGIGTYFTKQEGTLIPATINGNQWAQYRVELHSDGTSTPILGEVKLNYR
ncbi:hypothetical protein HY621_04260 [Candidatus Uhrbacteria bacterium]|nr:hypothetical protein [Candidatus Uhrbacteria bacterium]